MKPCAWKVYWRTVMLHKGGRRFKSPKQNFHNYNKPTLNVVKRWYIKCMYTVSKWGRELAIGTHAQRIKNKAAKPSNSWLPLRVMPSLVLFFFFVFSSPFVLFVFFFLFLLILLFPLPPLLLLIFLLLLRLFFLFFSSYSRFLFLFDEDLTIKLPPFTYVSDCAKISCHTHFIHFYFICFYSFLYTYLHVYKAALAED